MVASGIMLFVTTAQNVLTQDNISIATNQRQERVLTWRDEHLTVECSWDSALELEREITERDLPEQLKMVYDSLLPLCTSVTLEKVYGVWSTENYEFACIKNSEIIVFEY